MLQDIAQLSGALEIERLGSQIDPVAHASHHFVSTAVEKEQDFIDHGAVLLPRLQQHARRLAPPDVIIETRPLRRTDRQIIAARSHGEDALHDVERTAHRTHVRVRTEVARAVVDELSGDVDARKGFLHRHLDVRIRLVVSERDVVLRPVLLDEIRFENEGVRLAGDDDRVDRGGLEHQRPRPHALEVVDRDVAPHAGTKPLRLTHIQHVSVRVTPEIHSGRLRQMRDLVENGVGNTGHGTNYTACVGRCAAPRLG